MKLVEIDRNDFAEAKRYYEENKPISPEEYRTLMDLQDDPEKFDHRTGDWEIQWDSGVIESEPMTQENQT